MPRPSTTSTLKPCASRATTVGARGSGWRPRRAFRVGEWPPTARRRFGAEPASARCSPGCWRTCVAVRARSWSSGARRGSARRRCCSTALGRPLVFASRGLRVSSPRWSCPSRGCTSSARRCSSASARFPSRSRSPCASPSVSPPAMLPTASWSPWPRSLCWRRWRRSGRCCVSSTTRNGSTAPRARSSDSSHVGCWRSRWRSCSRCVTPPSSASSWACRSCTWKDSLTRMPAPCSRPSSRAESTSASGTGSWPRRAATRLRCWSSHEGSRPRSWRADSGCRSRCRCRCRAGSRRASCGGSRSCRTRRGGCSWSPRRSPSATRH